jgi:hypothetical protein
MKRTQPATQALWLAIGVTAFFVMASSSPQCARSSDHALNPTLDAATSNPVADCKQGCIETFQHDKAEEQARHKAAVAGCNGDGDCKSRESELHSSIIDDLVAIKDACKLACEHQQGSGIGGQ